MSLSGVVVVALDVVETVGTVCSSHMHHLGEVGEIYSVLALLASGNDGQEVVAPHDLRRNKGGPHLAGGAGGLRRAVQEDDQLKLLLVERVHRHLEERAALVNDVVEREWANEEEVVFASVHREVDIHLVHDDRLPVWRVCRSQQLAVELASYHQGLAQVGHSDWQAKRAVFGADDCHFTKWDGFGPLFRRRDFGQDHSAHEAVDDGSEEGLDDEKGHSTRAERGERSSTVPNSCLGLEGVEERCGETFNILNAWSVTQWGALPCQVSITAADPVPQQAKNEPAEGKRGDEEEENKAPADFHKGGPEVSQEGKVFAVLDVSVFDVAATVFGHQSGPAFLSLSQSFVDTFVHGSEHFPRAHDSIRQEKQMQRPYKYKVETRITKQLSWERFLKETMAQSGDEK